MLQIPVPQENPRAAFQVDGAEYSQALMLSENADDAQFCEWLLTAKVGDTFPAFVSCKRVR